MTKIFNYVVILLRSIIKYYINLLVKFILFIVLDPVQVSHRKIKQPKVNYSIKKLFKVSIFIKFLYRLILIILFLHLFSNLVFLVVAYYYIDNIFYLNFWQYTLNSIKVTPTNYNQTLFFILSYFKQFNFCMYTALINLNGIHLNNLHLVVNESLCLYKFFNNLADNNTKLLYSVYIFIFIFQIFAFFRVLLDYTKYLHITRSIPDNAILLTAFINYLHKLYNNIILGFKNLFSMFSNKIIFFKNIFYNNIFLKASFKLFKFNIFRKIEIPSFFFFWKPSSKRTPYFKNIKKK